MTELQRLIKELCPNGVEVESRTIGEVCEVGDGNHSSKYPKSNEMVEQGVPFIRGTNMVNGTISAQDMKYITEGKHQELKKGHLKAYDVLLANRGEVGKIAQVPKHFDGSNLNSQLAWLRAKQNVLLPRYLFYALNTSHVQSKISGEGGALQQITIKNIKLIQIPIPPLEVQKEVVRILDTFTELTSELTNELTARKKQYNYYRDELLSFGEEVEWKRLGEVSQIYDGTHATPQYLDSGVKFISVENIDNIYGTNKYISEEAYGKYKIKTQINDVFMTRIGTIGACTVVEKDEDLAYYVTLALIRPTANIISSKFLKYVVESSHGRKELRKRTLLNAVPIKINLGDIGKIQIPLPPLSEQERIVEILDRFDALCNDLSQGLPAEIEARKKQYEYYRDKLLSFERLEA